MTALWWYLKISWTQTATEFCNSYYLAKYQSSAVSAVLGMTRISALSIIGFKAIIFFYKPIVKSIFLTKKTLKEYLWKTHICTSNDQLTIIPTLTNPNSNTVPKFRLETSCNFLWFLHDLAHAQQYYRDRHTIHLCFYPKALSEIAAYFYRGHPGISSPTEARKFPRIIAKPNFPSLDSSTVFNLKLHVVQIREKIVFFRPFKGKKNKPKNYQLLYGLHLRA